MFALNFFDDSVIKTYFLKPYRVENHVTILITDNKNIPYSALTLFSSYRYELSFPFNTWPLRNFHTRLVINISYESPKCDDYSLP